MSSLHLFAGLRVRDFPVARPRYERLFGEPDERETYANGVRNATFRDADGNEIGSGGPPAG